MIKIDPRTVQSWSEEVGYMGYVGWLRLRALQESSTEPLTMNQTAKDIGIDKSSFYRSVIRPLWNVGLIDLHEMKVDSSPLIQLKVYPYPFNDSQQQVLKKVRDFDCDYIQPKAKGYVYFIRENINGTIKIGKSKNIFQRLKTFEVQLPFEVELLFFIPTLNMHQLEKKLHKQWESKRVGGEWFALQEEDLTLLQSHYSIQNPL